MQARIHLFVRLFGDAENAQTDRHAPKDKSDECVIFFIDHVQ